MATPPNAATALANSQSALNTIQTAADTNFISDAAIAIAQATAQGKYFVVLTTNLGCNIVNLQTYFEGLNYSVFFLDLPNPNVSPMSPASLFGEFWFQWWATGGLPVRVHNPWRLRISWNPPSTAPYPYP
jgi:hypothetical protein